jgi:hypothetical protein
MTSKRICFHGTDERAAMKILDEGFADDSWFAMHLEDALMCGGPWVFQVVFDEPACGWDKLDWQFHDAAPVPPDRIIALDHHTVDAIVEDAAARKRVFDDNMKATPPGRCRRTPRPGPTVAELAVALHKKWQSLATWTRPQAFGDLSEGEQCRWLELASWLHKGTDHG